MKFTQVQFIETVLDIANNGWANSIIGEDQKNWVCGRIMSRLPDDWVRSMFQAAVDGINNDQALSDISPNENEGMTVPPTNETTAHEETPIPPQVATLSEEECSDSEKPTRLPVEECIGDEDEDDDDCAEDAEAEQRRYEAKMDAADMKLLAEIDAREKQQKHSAQLLKNAELMKTIQEQNTADNQNRTLSEIATLLGQSSNTVNTQTNVHNNEKNSIFQSNGMPQ